MTHPDAGEYGFSWIVTQQDGVAVLSATGDLDLASAAEFRRGLSEATSGGRPPLVVADLGGVEFCDSSGLNALIQAANAVEAAGGRLVLSGLRPRVARLLRVTGLDRRFHAADDVAAAASVATGSGEARTSCA
ncbi:STAS domain-containing protein [Actinomadura sp. ATCC 31491]|uniref:Anti-sigma factor antagonist n=1 Tax=Actinomadura luzonensis TaxID=2805427 RepID=A0ABT0FTR3_9ACTN|nr:STAS domain-containing protein [Actinomadura luzonensis]MCK2215725.1 STAS domain-containing protein [Actinomadura luzonensis]